MPPTYGLGMHPAYSYGIQPPTHIQWNPLAGPLFINPGKYIFVFTVIYNSHSHEELTYHLQVEVISLHMRR